MKEEKKYRVFTDEVHEYNIKISNNEEGHEIYALVRTGKTWCETVQGQTVCQMTNDGNGYHITSVDAFMDYAEVLELQTLLQFISWYESRNATISSVVTIECCKEKLRFSI